MIPSVNIKERTPIWIALSDFYLDTELQDSDFRYIAKTILESPYTFDEIKSINKYEVFPVLQSNLMQPAGEWAGFNEKILIKAITDHLAARNRINTMMISISYARYGWMQEDYWERLEKMYTQMKKDQK
ncbi:DUF7079 family protein [Chryseobacterium kwangjuense]|uniref:DUF7079 domain-containing protein n=1 Tax=Chryseobacterium kwangjuense TaxID=267125 RepID=A0A135WI54_9FLAO|nr:hypothetical protein [Chryseobacterium kwangjuense]KXH84432.1 hypothetical protein AU378_01335 [Chryseobacterium kwangjuense]